MYLPFTALCLFNGVQLFYPKKTVSLSLNFIPAVCEYATTPSRFVLTMVFFPFPLSARFMLPNFLEHLFRCVGLVRFFSFNLPTPLRFSSNFSLQKLNFS